MELAAYEMAEAETMERAAALSRLRASKRIASVHAEMRHWLREYEKKAED